MIITLNTRSEYTPGTLIIDKQKGVYGVVLIKSDQYLTDNDIRMKSYKVKSLNLSKYRIIRKLQLLIIKKAFQ